MATWQVTGPSSGHHYLIYTVNQTSQDVTNNKSTLSWTIQLKADSGWSFSQWGSTVDAKINGVTVYNNYAQRSISGGTTITIASGTTTVPHNSDGTKTVTCECTWTQSSFSSYTPGNMSITGKTLTLTTIPRGSTLGNISSFTFGNAVTIPITKHSSSFTDNLVVSVSGTPIKTVNGIANGYSLTFTSSELNTIYSKLPNSDRGTVTFALTTKSGTTTIGTSSKTTTGIIPGNVIPTISDISITELNSTVANLGAGYIKGYSRLKLTITGATPGTGATISSYKIIANGNTINDSTGNTTTLVTAGTNTLTATVTDSRGRVATKTKSINVVDYKSPTITLSKAERDKTTPTKMTLTLKGSIVSLSAKNSASYTVKSKVHTATGWTIKASNIAISGTTIDLSLPYTTYDVKYTYDVLVTVTDKLSSTTVSLVLPTDTVIMDENKDGVGIGKYWEKGVLDVAGDIYIGDMKAARETIYIDAPGNTANEFLKNAIDALPNVDGTYIFRGGWSGQTWMTGLAMVAAGGRYKQVAVQSPFDGLLTGRVYDGVYSYYGGNAAPHVVESGSNNFWMYRKWSNGQLEVSGKIYVSNIQISTTMGSMFRSEKCFSDGWASYPIPFSVIFSYNQHYTTTNNIGALTWPTGNPVASLTYPISPYLVRPTTETATGFINIEVTGRWK